AVIPPQCSDVAHVVIGQRLDHLRCPRARTVGQPVQTVVAISERAVCRSSMSPQLLGNVTIILRIGQYRVAVLMVVQLVGELRRTRSALPPPLVVLVAHRGQE